MNYDKNEVKSRLDIVQVIGETVTLKQSGKNYMGFCPFHDNTKTPALSVSHDKQIWSCFGACGIEGGDIFMWIMKRDGIDFKQALAALAHKAGLNGHHPQTAATTTKPPYTGLDDYAAAHGVPADVFKAVGWAATTHHDRPALVIKTDTGPRWRYLDGQDPKYWHQSGYKRCWYRLAQAVDLTHPTRQPLVICNGEASTIVAQHFGLAAVAIAGGSEKPTIPQTLVNRLKEFYTGPVIVALDCDKAGRDNAPKLAQFLTQAGFTARAVDLALGNEGQDLADFCKLYQHEAAAKLPTLKDLDPPKLKDPETKIKSADFLAALQTLGYSFRLNVLDDTVEVNEIPLDDIQMSQIKVKMWDMGYTKYLPMMEHAYIAAAADNSYHPIKAYLESLKWDGQPHIDTLATYFTDTQGSFSLWLKKWLVGSVGKVYGQAQNCMLVLEGMQGKGKSYFAKYLCPLQKYFVESSIQPDNKDYLIRLAKTWIWEVTELGATTRKADREALKAFITLGDITARKSYGKRDINKPALASFIGTVNDEAGFLNDPTGSRRFLTCTLTRIDWSYTQIKVEDIWAEAYHLYQSGYNWRLTPDEQKLQAEINEAYEVEDPLRTAVLQGFHLTGKTDEDWLSSREVLEKIGLDPLNPSNTMRLSRTMKKLNIPKGKQGPAIARINGYFGLVLRV
jgi:hypothetical protein